MEVLYKCTTKSDMLDLDNFDTLFFHISRVPTLSLAFKVTCGDTWHAFALNALLEKFDGVWTSMEWLQAIK